MIKLYDTKLSGNSWKIRLALKHLGLPFERVSLSIPNGDLTTDEFTNRNSFQRVPVIELENGDCLKESAAILMHFAESSSLLPKDPVKRNTIISWLFFEQADLMRFLAYPRVFHLTGQADKKAEMIKLYHEIAASALQRVEEALAHNNWIAGDAISIADYALYPYIKLAPEGGMDLSPFPNISKWMRQIEGLPSYEALIPDLETAK